VVTPYLAVKIVLTTCPPLAHFCHLQEYRSQVARLMEACQQSVEIANLRAAPIAPGIELGYPVSGATFAPRAASGTLDGKRPDVKSVRLERIDTGNLPNSVLAEISEDFANEGESR